MEMTARLNANNVTQILQQQPSIPPRCRHQAPRVRIPKKSVNHKDVHGQAGEQARNRSWCVKTRSWLMPRGEAAPAADRLVGRTKGQRDHTGNSPRFVVVRIRGCETIRLLSSALIGAAKKADVQITQPVTVSRGGPHNEDIAIHTVCPAFLYFSSATTGDTNGYRTSVSGDGDNLEIQSRASRWHTRKLKGKMRQ